MTGGPTGLRLLQVAQRLACQPTTGAELRMYHLAAELGRHMAVTQIGFWGGSEPCPAPPAGCPVEFRQVPRGGTYRPVDLVLGALGKVPFSVRNYTRDSMRSALAALLDQERFDVVQLEIVHLGEYLPLLRNARHRPAIVACDWHNIESEVLHRYADSGGGFLRRAYARQAARQLEAYERRFVNLCDLHIVVSDRDREALVRYGTRAPIIHIDNGVDLRSFAFRPPAGSAAPPQVLYVGSMDYHANIEAVGRFAAEVWPSIRRELPEAVFTVVGRNPHPSIRALGGRHGIEVTGTVADVRPFYHAASVLVVPILIAGGTRIKILEAMAAGLPVVSTARGAEGLAAVPGTHYLLAEGAADLCAAVLRVVGDPALGNRLAEAGVELVRRRYDWAALGDQLAACYARLNGRV